MSRSEPRELVITGSAVMSALGSDPRKLCADIADGVAAELRPPDGRDQEACTVATRAFEFDRTALLGEKGVQYMDRAQVMAAWTVGNVLKDAALGVTPDTSRRLGIVMGTAAGSFRSISEFTHQALTADPPHAVSPMMFPNVVLNAATAQAAIWHRVHGLNSTVSQGHLSSLMALRYAAMALRLGYADAIVAGAVEELCPQSAWARHRAQPVVSPGHVLGEGAACVVLEPADLPVAPGRARIARWLGSGVENMGARSRSKAMADCVERTVRQADLASEQISILVAQSSASDALAAADIEALRGVLGSTPSLRILSVEASLGDCYGAAGMFQVICAATQLRVSGGIALVTSASRDAVGCALLAA